MTSESGPSLSCNDHVTSSESHVSGGVGHVTALNHHETPPPPGRDDEEESEDDTAGEGGDTIPPDSTSTTTTDAINDPIEPIDFIETHPHSHAHCFNGDTRSSGRNILPDWSLLEVMGDKKGISVQCPPT